VNSEMSHTSNIPQSMDDVQYNHNAKS